MYRKEYSYRRGYRAGITLIEMLVVITIIALFSAVAYQRLAPAMESGRRGAAKTQVTVLFDAAQNFNLQKGRFPTQEEGLPSLREFLTKDLGLDPWGNPYVYRFPGEHGPEPDILSYGADGEEGGEGPAEDIVSWK